MASMPPSKDPLKAWLGSVPTAWRKAQVWDFVRNRGVAPAQIFLMEASGASGGGQDASPLPVGVLALGCPAVRVATAGLSCLSVWLGSLRLSVISPRGLPVSCPLFQSRSPRPASSLPSPGARHACADGRRSAPPSAGRALAAVRPAALSRARTGQLVLFGLQHRGRDGRRHHAPQRRRVPWGLASRSHLQVRRRPGEPGRRGKRQPFSIAASQQIEKPASRRAPLFSVFGASSAPSRRHKLPLAPQPAPHAASCPPPPARLPLPSDCVPRPLFPHARRSASARVVSTRAAFPAKMASLRATGGSSAPSPAV